jgi:hypothetical protein
MIIEQKWKLYKVMVATWIYVGPDQGNESPGNQ